MVEVVVLIAVGLAGGLIGGMGMGGGTLLIPLLTLAAGLDQHVAQTVNLVAFVPMSLAALCVHFKNKLIEFRYFFWIALPATAAGIASALLSRAVDGKSLSAWFGLFLIALGVYQLVCIVVSAVRDRKKKPPSLFYDGTRLGAARGSAVWYASGSGAYPPAERPPRDRRGAVDATGYDGTTKKSAEKTTKSPR